MNGTIVSFQTMKDQYPNEWILVGNPILNEPESVGSVASKLTGGVLLFHSADKSEVAQKAKDVRGGFLHTACVFTGDLPRNRKFWL